MNQFHCFIKAAVKWSGGKSSGPQPGSLYHSLDSRWLAHYCLCTSTEKKRARIIRKIICPVDPLKWALGPAGGWGVHFENHRAMAALPVGWPGGW